MGNIASTIGDHLPSFKSLWNPVEGIKRSVATVKGDLQEVGLMRKPSTPVDPAAERAAAAAEATTQANARLAAQRKAMRDNSLLTGAGQSAAGSGRSTLGV